MRAAEAGPERIVVCSCYTQGLDLALRTLAQNGIRVVAYEDPGSPATTSSAAASAGLSAIPVPVDGQGIDVHALAATAARAVIITPAHQWPTGVALSPERRLALIEWAERRKAVIIEDDCDAEFRYDRQPVCALQGLAADSVFSIGTISKSLVPALRIGWILCLPALIGRLTCNEHLSDRGSPALDQLALGAPCPRSPSGGRSPRLRPADCRISSVGTSPPRRLVRSSARRPHTAMKPAGPWGASSAS